MIETITKSYRDEIPGRCDHDGDGRCDVPCRDSGGRSPRRDDDVDCTVDEFASKLRKPIEVALGRARFVADARPIRVAEPFQLPPKQLDVAPRACEGAE